MEHKEIILGHMHRPHNWVVADATARLSVVVDDSDVGKYLWQESDQSEWLLLSTTPTASWRNLTAAGAHNPALVVRTAGETISALTAVWEDTAGVVRPLGNDDIEHAPLRLGITTTAASQNADVSVQLSGQLDVTGLAFHTGTVWVGADGRLTQVAPQSGVDICAGTVVSTDRLYVDFSESIYLQE